MKRLGLLLLFMLMPAWAWAEITIDVSPGPINPGEMIVLQVNGLADKDLSAAKVDWSPKVGVQVIPAKLWGGSPVLLFTAKQPGKYNLSVALNGWRNAMTAAVQQATAANIDAEMLKSLVALNTQMATAYPIDMGICAVEVGTVHPPPPPPPPPGTAVSVFILTENDDLTPAQQLLLNQFRNDPRNRAVRAHDVRAGQEGRAQTEQTKIASAHFGLDPLVPALADQELVKFPHSVAVVSGRLEVGKLRIKQSLSTPGVPLGEGHEEASFLPHGGLLQSIGTNVIRIRSVVKGPSCTSQTDAKGATPRTIAYRRRRARA